MNEQTTGTEHKTGWLRHPFWLPLLGAGVLATGGATYYESTQAENLRKQFTASQNESLALRAQLKESDSDLQNSLKAVRDELNQVQKDTSVNVAKVQTIATRHADLVANRIVKHQQEETKQLSEELGKVKDSATEASTRLDGISTTVGSVRTDVDSAKSEIQQTKSDIHETQSELQRARGDMGAISGLIATNSKEIQMLRELGDRNIYEFTVSKNGGLQKVGDIQVTLRKADAKRNRFTLTVLADDKTVEKKDRTINEPVQFYTSKARQPYELVVNEVGKDKVHGYLATPKVTAARNMTPASNP